MTGNSARRAAKLALVAVAVWSLVHPTAARELQPWGGGPTPALELKDLDGRAHRLAAYRGQVVVLNFWATWCEPCRNEMPALNRLKARVGTVAVLAVNFAEGEARIREFLKQVPVDFTILLDRDGAVAKAWQARLLPYTVILDPAGRIRYTARGELDWSAPDLQAKLRALAP